MLTGLLPDERAVMGDLNYVHRDAWCYVKPGFDPKVFTASSSALT
jgi:hypothetical protein